MLWIVMKDDSHNIIACNVHQKEDVYELWVTRPTGKSLLITSNEDRKQVYTIKDAIDYAIEHGEPVLRL